MQKLLLAGLLTLALVLTTGAPASATIHDIVASWCSGHHVQDPPGLTGQSNPKAGNFAKPLFATGVVSLVPYDSDGDDEPDALLVDIDDTHPASKVETTGNIIGPIPGAGPGGADLFFEETVLSHPAFDNCPNLISH